MTPQQVIDIGALALMEAVKLAAPFLLVVLAVGVAVGLFQAVTSIQEQTLSFVPKLIGCAIVLLVASSWMISSFITFVNELYARVPSLIQGG